MPLLMRFCMCSTKAGKMRKVYYRQPDFDLIKASQAVSEAMAPTDDQFELLGFRHVSLNGVYYRMKNQQLNGMPIYMHPVGVRRVYMYNCFLDSNWYIVIDLFYSPDRYATPALRFCCELRFTHTHLSVASRQSGSKK